MLNPFISNFIYGLNEFKNNFKLIKLKIENCLKSTNEKYR
jgi:hypothetical protein